MKKIKVLGFILFSSFIVYLAFGYISLKNDVEDYVASEREMQNLNQNEFYGPPNDSYITLISKHQKIISEIEKKYFGDDDDQRSYFCHWLSRYKKNEYIFPSPIDVILWRK